tara:strand:+ start:98 stop:481 length:384 start_codon:yes stop_codon:yes gene_type:complete
MSHTNSPEYFTISTVNQYDGETTVLAICEDMDAVMWRLKQCYSSCGDEYRINCYHLTTAEEACEKYTEQMVSRRKYEKMENHLKGEYEAKKQELIDAAQPLSKLEEEYQYDGSDSELEEELASHDVG